jgi:hypothetical protein
LSVEACGITVAAPVGVPVSAVSRECEAESGKDEPVYALTGI